MKLIALALTLTLAACAAEVELPQSDAGPCSCSSEISTIELSNENDAGVLEGNFVHVLTYGCSPEGVDKPAITCDRDVYTVVCHNATLHFHLADDHGVCTAQLAD